MKKASLFVGALLIFSLSACYHDGDDAPPIDPVQATARRIVDEADLIGGPMSMGRISDYLLTNDRIRVIIQDVGRDPLGFVSPYGGGIIDADLVRGPGEPGRDNFYTMSPQINIESTFRATSIVVVNDGSNGEAAVLRASGVDDSLDSINASGLLKSIGGGIPLSVPASADDVDIPVELVTEFSLAPGANSVKIETFIKNTGHDTLGVYIGDYLIGAGGETELFVPGAGFGEPLVRMSIDFIALAGEKSAEGIAYGYVPEIVESSTAFTQTGVTATSLGMNVIGMLLLGLPSNVQIPPWEVYSYVRHFVVAEDLASVQDARNEIFSLETGVLRGRITAWEAPLRGATVSVVRTPGTLGADYEVLSAFRTDADGHFEGTLPVGRYGIMAAKEGYTYRIEPGTCLPQMISVDISAGGITEVETYLGDPGSVRILAEDEAGRPSPCKATIVGFDPSPPLTNTQSLLGLMDFKGYVFDDPDGEDLFGLAKTVFVGADGDSGVFFIEPGTYHLYVSRGPEYSLFESPLRVFHRQMTTVEAQVARVIDTTGFVSGDFHVHMINSPDSRVPLTDRVTAYLAEGVDYLVATDHEYLTDLGPTIEALGAEDLLATSTGQEITPQDYGHFNGWPLSIDSARRNMGAVDWARWAPVGEDYSSLGAYCMTPAEIFAAVRADDGEEVVQINHINSGGGGGMNILGIDTGEVPPISLSDPAQFRLDPDTANLFSPNFDTLELLIGNDRDQVDTFFAENLGDWFNLLNQGLVYTGTSDSDTHHWNNTQAGTFRNFIAYPTDSPADIDEDEITRRVKEGRIVGGYSPFLRASVHAVSTGETGGLSLGLPTLITTTDGRAVFHLDVQGPAWAEYDTVALYMNSIPDAYDHDCDPSTAPEYTAVPDVVLTAGVDFDVVEVVDHLGIPGASHFESSVDYTLDGLVEDTWIVALVWGTDGVSRPLFPVVPNDLDEEVNLSLEDLTDGNLGESGMLALAFTNPLFIDVDGDGAYDSPLP